MKSINIFVAGAKRLQQERTCINSLANKLSSKYQSRDISIIAKSFEDFKDDQNEYNIFIKETADIVIFLIDGYLGDKTKDEFITATDSLSKTQRPEVIVFMRDYGQNITPELKDAKDFVTDKLKNRYYVEYKKGNDGDLSDLKYKIQDRLLRYIDKIDLETSAAELEKSKAELGKTKSKLEKTKEELEKSKTELEDTKNKLKGKRILQIVVVLLVALLLSGHFFLKPILKPSSNEPSLIFAGGGSVRNFIEYETGRFGDTIIVDEYQKYPNSISIPLPSGSAWRLLQEEVQHNHRIETSHNSTGNKFITICLSAGEMDSTFIKDQNSIFKKSNQYIKRIELNIGNDTLAVYLSNDLASNKEFIINNNTITCTQLTSLLRANKTKQIATVYTTTNTSGTLNSYFLAVKNDPDTKNDTALIQQYEVFYDYTHYADIKKPFIVLGSTYYTAKDMEDYTRLILINSKGEPVCKPTCLYFLAYENGTNKEGKYLYKIEKPIVDFLNCLHLQLDTTNADWKKKESDWNRLMNKGIILKHTYFKATIGASN